jgi:hypothetical protein
MSELTSAQDIQHSFQVVNHCCQADLCLGSGETPLAKSVGVRRYGTLSWRTDVPPFESPALAQLCSSFPHAVISAAFLANSAGGK